MIPRWPGMHIDVPWFYDPNGTKPTPLVLGNPADADLVIISESERDPLAYIDCYQLHQQQEVSWAVIITRGSANGARVPANFKAGAGIIILAQTMKPVLIGKQHYQETYVNERLSIMHPPNTRTLMTGYGRSAGR